MAPKSTPPPAPTPLVPVALAVGLGVYVERMAPLPLQMLLGLLVGTAAAWLLAVRRRRAGSTVMLWCLAGLLAAMWHRVNATWPADAVGHFATQDRMLVRVRGTVAEDVDVKQPGNPELRSTVNSPRSTFLLDVKHIHLGNQWLPVTGVVRVSVEGNVKRVMVGDGVELFGALVALMPPVNPGGMDIRQIWLDQGIQALVALKSPDAIVSHPESASWSVAMLMARSRAWVRAQLATWLPPKQAGLAQALLCGEQAALLPEQFEGYLQTGVYHVLAVSGQHLVVLLAFAGFFLRFTGQSMRSRAVWLALFVILYMLLTGARPPVVRAAVIVLTWCGGWWLRRRTNQLNCLALAWIIVAMINPADLANTGCQLSFLAVLLMTQIIGTWYSWAMATQSPLDQLEARFRWIGLRFLYWVALNLKWSFFVSLVVWIGVDPLVAHRFHLISPVAIFLSPPLALLISLALIAGLSLVLLAGIPILAEPLAWFLTRCLAWSDWLVEMARSIPFGHFYWPDLPTWWVHSFYFALVGLVVLPQWQRWWKALVAGSVVWFIVGFVITRPDIPEGLRVTILSVGHGTAMVLETEDGRCILYDAGSLAGPEVAQRHVASYLWYRGRTKIDEVFISHADLDHFNALIDLSERFRLGGIRLTPSFSQRPDAGIKATLRAFEQRGVPVRVIVQGERIESGPLTIEALHPPPQGPPGPENARSLVLLVTYQGHTLLLTGDLEQAGMERVLREPMDPVDVLIAPHHGSKASNTERFAQWCQPRLVISSETYPRSAKPDPYTPLGATLWRTWVHGGVTVTMNAKDIQARTHLTRQLWPPRRP
jgi:competence protein ComEC